MSKDKFVKKLQILSDKYGVYIHSIDDDMFLIKYGEVLFPERREYSLDGSDFRSEKSLDK